jgi:hypothetical protein
MGEICAKCGREIDWCNCVEITKDGKEKPGFVSSGRVAVSVEFVEAVRHMCDSLKSGKGPHGMLAVISILDQMEGGGK